MSWSPVMISVLRLSRCMGGERAMHWRPNLRQPIRCTTSQLTPRAHASTSSSPEAIPHLPAMQTAHGLLKSQPQRASRATLDALMSLRRVSPSSASSSKSTLGLQRPNHLPLSNQGPGQTLQYPFPIRHLTDREAIVYDQGMKPSGVERLDGRVFNALVRIDILHRVVRYLMALWQQGTHKAKSRGEVSGGSRKPRPQKKTGMSRQGSTRSPIWKGGGTTFGPTPRSHAHKLPSNIRRMGMKCALSAKCNEGRLVVVETLSSESNRGPPLHPSVMAALLRSIVEKSPAPPAHHAGMGVKGLGASSGGAKGGQVTGAEGPRRRRLTSLFIDCGEYGRDGGKRLRRSVELMGAEVNYQVMSVDDVTVYHILRQQVLVMTRPALLKISQRLLAPSLQLKHSKRAWWEQESEKLKLATEDLLSAAQR